MRLRSRHEPPGHGGDRSIDLAFFKPLLLHFRDQNLQILVIGNLRIQLSLELAKRVLSLAQITLQMFILLLQFRHFCLVREQRHIPLHKHHLLAIEALHLLAQPFHIRRQFPILTQQRLIPLIGRYRLLQPRTDPVACRFHRVERRACWLHLHLPQIPAHPPHFRAIFRRRQLVKLPVYMSPLLLRKGRLRSHVSAMLHQLIAHHRQFDRQVRRRELLQRLAKPLRLRSQALHIA